MRRSWRMLDFGLMLMLKVLYCPIGVTPIAICQQCISRAMDMVNICSCIVLKS